MTPDFSLEFVLEPSDEVVEGRLNPKFWPAGQPLEKEPFDAGDGQVCQGCGTFWLETSLFKGARETNNPVRDEVLKEMLEALRVN